MSSIVQWVRYKIEESMESPAEREKKWEERLRGVEAAAKGV